MLFMIFLIVTSYLFQGYEGKDMMGLQILEVNLMVCKEIS